MLDINDEIEKLDLSIRTYNCLKRAGCHSIQDVINLGEDGLSNVKNLGKKSFEETLARINAVGFMIPEVGENVVVDPKTNNAYLRGLKVNGIGFLKTLPAKKFMKDSETMEEISASVELFLNHFVKERLADKSDPTRTRQQLEKSIEEKVQKDMEEYKHIVETKRDILNEAENNLRFTNSMKTKIGEVRKYKFSPDKNKEESHKRNPFVNEDELGV